MLTARWKIIKGPAMYTIPPKKMLALNILRILQRYTDVEHTLSQKQIAEKLESDFQMTVDRKSIKRNLDSLIDSGYEIECTENTRMKQTGEAETITAGWYLQHEFENSELRLLIDSILFSRQIPQQQCLQLIKKLEGLSNCHFNVRVKHVHSLPETSSASKQLFYTIDILDEAMANGVQVAFHYGIYDVDKSLHPRLDGSGSPKRYVMDPYQLVAANGRYYLVCRNENYDGLANYRVDRIMDIELLETPLIPLHKLKGYANGLDLPKHIAEHIYMFSGESVRVRFRVSRSALMHVFDWFGSNIRFENETDTDIEVVIRVNAQAMRYWALQFGEYVEVLEPPSLREQLCEAVRALADRYRDPKP